MLLALAGSAAQQGLSVPAILSLPLLFASGMTLLDTLDGVAMTHAYAWALDNPRAKRGYNLLVTGVSGAVALAIGSVTLLQWTRAHFAGAARTLAVFREVDVSALGFWLAGLTLIAFMVTWWRFRAMKGPVSTDSCLHVPLERVTRTTHPSRPPHD